MLKWMLTFKVTTGRTIDKDIITSDLKEYVMR